MILDSPIISGSLTQQAGQTAEIPRYTAVSSSFLAASASFDARIDSIESTTASFSPRINALESFTASANATYVNASGDSMSGDLTITGSLIVTDRITAQEFHTEYVSSSIVFQSGSTKFGDSGDDVHSFTGSLKVDGNVIASNLNGIFSSSAQLTSSLGDFFIISGTITQTTWDNIASKPGGIVSGSSQVVSLLPTGVVSGSSQITYSSISSIPAGIVSGAMQVTESLDVRYRLVGDDITFAELTFKPTLISGSSQLDGTTIQNLSGSFSGSFSGSYRGDGSGLTGLAAGAKFHTQSTPASTWTFVHNLSTQYPNVTVYGSNDTIILPQSITATNANTLVLEFGTPVAGYATAGIGGTIEVNGRTIKQYFTSSLSWRFEHNFGDRFANIQTYDSNYEKVIPETIVLTDTTSSLITFPEATAGWAIGTIGGDLPAISSSYSGYVLQVSAGAPYTASWSPIAYVTASNAVNALTASYLNSFSQSLIPAVSGAYDLGSVDKPFRHIYVGTGSIYLVDNTGTIVKTLTGDSIVTNDNLSSLNSFTASNFTTNTFTSSATARLNSIETITSSNIARLIALETTSASVDTTNTIQNSRLNSLEEKTGSLATTGSNTFIGTQTITGSLYITTDLIVQGSSSLQNITASAVSIGTNIINLNTANPAIRYAGLVIGDSGSVGSSGSFLYDSVQDEFIFVHRGANTMVTSSVLLMGPQTYDSIGNETYLTTNKIPKGAGNEHLADSNISDNGTTIILNSNTEVTSSLKVSGSISIGTSETTGSLTIQSKFVTGQSGSLLNIKSSYTNKNSIIELAEISSDGAIIIKHALATSPTIMLTSQTGGSAHTYFNIAGNFGIGTTNPQRKFVVADGSGNGLEISNSSGYSTILAYNRTTSTYQDIILGEGTGRVGIGVTNPQYKLSVANPGGSSFLGISNEGNATGHRQLRMGFGGAGANTYAEIQGTRLSIADDVSLVLQPGGGNVGIGITAPTAALHTEVSSTTWTSKIINTNTSTNNAGLLIKAGVNSGNEILLAQKANGTNVFLVDASGNVGIGTNNPLAKLEVKASGDGDLFIARFSGGAAKLIYGYQSGADGYLELRTGADNIITKLSGYSGTASYFMSKVGIGITNPTRQLHVAEANAVLRVGPDYVVINGSTDRDYIDIIAGGTTSQIIAPNEVFQIINAGGGGAAPYIDIIAGTSGGVRLTNTATSWTGISDIRIKDIIEPVTNAVSKLSNLSTIVYKLKDDESNQRKIGLIAQEVNEVLPEVVDIPLDDNIMWGIRYSEIVPVLVKAVQELKAEIEILKNK